MPTREHLTDPNWNFPKKGGLIKYLSSAPIVLCSAALPTYCQLCNENRGDPGCWRSDNVWLWHNTLAHEVEKHSIRLPDRMVEHIVNNQFTPLTEITVEADDLPWPNFSK
ncbi:MAG: hypothetical protein VSS75_015225 [Candidatus Parabeggiatoa sp.]|nr:hypothetical protein [Candidatus Parabeggiatoa sp.]